MTTNPILVWLSQLTEVLAEPASWGLFATGAAIYLIFEWRVRFFALVIQYLFVGVLFTRIFDTRPELAVMKILVGWLICGTFLISGSIRARARREVAGRAWASNLPFRALSLVTVTVVANLASQRYPLPYVPADVGLACFILVVLAILFIGNDENDPGVVGIGVLNLLTALDLFYSAQEPGLLVTGLLVVLSLLVGLAISYLTVAEVST